MRKIKKFILFITLLVFFILGCNKVSEIKTITNENIKELQEFKGTLIGNNSAVSSIINSLPGGATYREFEISDNSLKVIYGFKKGSSISEEEFSNYWLNEDTIEKNFFYNTASIFILVNNVDIVTLEVDSEKYYSFTISKSELEKELSHSITKYADDKELWENDIVNNYIKTKEKRKKFFVKYPFNES